MIRNLLLAVALFLPAAGGAAPALLPQHPAQTRAAEMQHRRDLYDLLRYHDYNKFDESIYNFQVGDTPVNAYLVEGQRDVVAIDATLTVSGGRAVRERIEAYGPGSPAASRCSAKSSDRPRNVERCSPLMKPSTTVRASSSRLLIRARTLGSRKPVVANGMGLFRRKVRPLRK